MNEQPNNAQVDSSSNQPNSPTNVAKQMPSVRLTLWSGAAILVQAILGVWLYSTQSVFSPAQSPSYMIGFVFGPFILALTLAYIGHLIARRSSTVFNVILCLVLGLAITSQAVQLAHVRHVSPRNAEIVQQLRSESDKVLDEIRRKTLTGEDASPSKETRDQALATLGSAARQSSGDQALYIRVTARAMKEIADRRESAEASLKAFTAAGVIDPTLLRSRERLAARIVLADRFVESCSAIEQLFRSLPSRIETLALEEGQPPPRAREASFELCRGMRQGQLLRFQSKSRELAEGYARHLRLLLDRFDDWSLTDDNKVLWSTDDQLELFNQSVMDLRALSDETTNLQMQLLTAPPRK